MDARDLYAYTVALRWRLLDALRSAPAELLQRDMATNHRSILQTLIHVMEVEQSWVHEDLQGQARLSSEEFRNRYLDGQASLEGVIEGWQRVSAETLEALRCESDLRRRVPSGELTPITVEQIILHLAAEEMIHMGEVLAMTRQLGIDLPS